MISLWKKKKIVKVAEHITDAADKVIDAKRLFCDARIY